MADRLPNPKARRMTKRGTKYMCRLISRNASLTTAIFLPPDGKSSRFQTPSHQKGAFLCSKEASSMSDQEINEFIRKEVRSNEREDLKAKADAKRYREIITETRKRLGLEVACA